MAKRAKKLSVVPKDPRPRKKREKPAAAATANPNGRPPSEVRELERELIDSITIDTKIGDQPFRNIGAAEACLRRLVHIAMDGPYTDSVRACDVLLNRRFGRARQALDVTAHEGKRVEFKILTADDIDEIKRTQE